MLHQADGTSRSFRLFHFWSAEASALFAFLPGSRGTGKLSNFMLRHVFVVQRTLVGFLQDAVA